MKVLEDVINLIKADIDRYEKTIDNMEYPKSRGYDPADDSTDYRTVAAQENFALKCRDYNNVIFGLNRALKIAEKFQKDILESESNWKNINNSE